MDAVYRIEDLRARVVALLRKEKKAITAGAIAVKLQLPFYAVQAGLESALVGELVEFASPDGWWIKAGVVS